MKAKPSISVIVVLYNSASLLSQCITPVADLARRGFVELILVDNDSRDDPAATLATLDVPYTLIPTGANLGFSSAVNIGVRASIADHILLLNPDVEYEASVLLTVYERIRADPTVGAIAPLLETSGILTANGGQQPKLRPMLAHATGLARQVRHGAPHAGHYLYVDALPGRMVDVEWLSGGFLLLCRDAAADDGTLLSERWFMYAEDIDLCNHLLQAGRRLVLCGDVRAQHAIGGSSGGAPSEVSTMWIRNLRDYHDQVLASNRASAFTWRVLVSAGYLARSLLALLQARTERRRSMRAYGAAVWMQSSSGPAAVREEISPRSARNESGGRKFGRWRKRELGTVE